MNEQTALQVRREPQSIIRTMEDAERAAKAMSASGFFADSRQAAQAVVKILAGQELGFGPFASMIGVNIIQGKVSLSANLLAAAIKRSGKYDYRIAEQDGTHCVLHFFEGGKMVGISTFTMEDAQTAGVTANPTWKKYPRNMLFARALSNGQKWFAPDIFGGATIYTPEELGQAVDEEGNAVGPLWQGKALEAGEEQPGGAPDTKAEPMPYEQAKTYQIKTSKGEKFIGELGVEDLNKVCLKSHDPLAVEAATIILAADHNLEPPQE